MDQNQWFNAGSPAPMNDRQAFEAGWTAAQRQMAYAPQAPQINERIFQQTPQQTPPPRPTYFPGRVVNSPDDIRASEIPMDGTVAVFPASDYSYIVLKAWNSNGSIQTEIYQLEYYCAKTKYYESVTEAMDEYGDADHFKMGRSGMMRVLPEYDRRDQRFDPDEYDIYGRMGYSGRVPHSNMGRNWDRYLDARRHYNATKSDSDRMEMSTSAKMHIGETIATLRDMWHDADPDLREKMKKDFSALLQEMN